MGPKGQLAVKRGRAAVEVAAIEGATRSRANLSTLLDVRDLRSAGDCNGKVS